MTGTAKRYYASGNTSKGAVSLLSSSLQGVKHVYVIQGGIKAARSEQIEKLGHMAAERGWEVWELHSPSVPGMLDGLIVPSLQIGVIDAESANAADEVQEGTRMEIIDLNAAMDLKLLEQHQEELERLAEHIRQLYKEAYAGFAEALRVHDDWEAVYIESMDFDAANEFGDSFVDRLFAGRRQERESRSIHRFLGAATPEGARDFVPNLTEGLKRYLIKGRAGSGKSTLLKKLAKAAAERGFDIEIYHCGFDPDSLDMVIVREIGVAVFDSTAPHEYFPEHADDEIIDTYELFCKPGTDEAHAETIQMLQEQYRSKMKESTAKLKEALSFRLEREKLLAQAFHPEEASRLAKEMLKGLAEK